MNLDAFKTRCPNPDCWLEAAEATTVCRNCKTDKINPQPVKPRCAYYGGPCKCDGRGLCLEAA